MGVGCGFFYRFDKGINHMDDLEKYYTDLDREVLSLVGFHERYIIYSRKKGAPEMLEKEMHASLEGIKELILSRAKTKQQKEQQDKEYHEKEMQQRTWGMCETCKQERRLLIVGEGINREHGWKADEVKCTVCANVFYSELPNNEKDRIDFFRYHAEYLQKLLRDKKATGAKRAEGEAIYAAMHKSYTDYAAKYAEVLKADERDAEILRKQDKKVEEIRDSLLVKKLEILQWNDQPMGEA
jgi:hypothetical protein